MNNTHTLYLIPNTLSEHQDAQSISEEVKQAIHHLTHFIVENEKSARALIKKLQLSTPQSELNFKLWNEHSKKEEMPKIVNWLKQTDVGIMSEAGLPCIADPGADIVRWAHHNQIKVKPLGGGSSMMMALMASGLSGQSYAFQGYLPIDKNARIKKLKELEGDAIRKKQTQLVMEAPYRNNALMEDLCMSLLPETYLSVACHIASPDELIVTRKVGAWRNTQRPDLHKKPTIFVFGVA
jgi:16S rRNA (cytidine1402-2'-O)-methyltransferase